MPDISRNRIEIWRSEVESQSSSQSGRTGLEDVGWSAPIVRPVGFWRRIFGLGTGKIMSIGQRLGLVKKEVERTGMYTVKSRDVDEVGGRRELVGRDMDIDGRSSMELDGSEESARDGLRERKNRLERAARLLGKNDGTEENGQRS
ncbi:47165877-d737-4efc-8bf2-882847460934 [Sclerotinia trifoliorum]|uniref:47165877-d737-4efc-8bf2-882847460934 n=1 Tax=Sclerotinia trifoliorum TaxID=28548 RepID=A0A8H2VN58_9HELO|nr:47165877-d737-4efc-8bf2-882847460934 [Sclerotinia trifoliorum]